MSTVIDLRKRYAIVCERDPVKGQVWIAKDLASFDPDPDSRMHIIGYGRSAQEATIELLEGIAAVAAETDGDSDRG